MALMVSVLCAVSWTLLINSSDVFFAWNRTCQSLVLKDALSNSHCASVHQSAFPKSDANLFEWIGTIEGPAGTVRVHSHRSSFASSSMTSIMPECHIKSRYTSRQIIPMSHLLSSSNPHVSIPMSILHLVQFALISFRCVFLSQSANFEVD
jgi:hypothetical protein